jgi:hypothetical protein
MINTDPAKYMSYIILFTAAAVVMYIRLITGGVLHGLNEDVVKISTPSRATNQAL